MSEKTIKVELSVQGIQKAIADINAYKQEFIKKCDIFRRKVADRIADEVRAGFASSIVFDDLITGETRNAQVNVTVYDRDGMSIVAADGADAVWVEFGTGVYYNGPAGSSPHPHGAGLNMVIGGFGKGHGKKEEWGFYEDGELRRTHGVPASMPMARAIGIVRVDLPQIAQEVWG